jgi:hypothetical protein
MIEGGGEFIRIVTDWCRNLNYVRNQFIKRGHIEPKFFGGLFYSEKLDSFPFQVILFLSLVLNCFIQMHEQ